MHTPAPTLGKAGLWVLLCGMLLPQIDFSIVNVALDAMGLSLHITPVQLALTVTVYGLCFAIALAPGSLLGDRYGRRKIFMLGIAGFGLASLACGLASSLTTLLVARAIQGITAALIVPQVLATIHVTLSGEHHSRAVGYYSAIGGLSFVIGQVSGGLLVSADIAGLGWRSVFLINLPLAVILLLIVPRCIPETRSEHSHSVDWAGAMLLAGFVFSLLLPLTVEMPLWQHLLILLLAAICLTLLMIVSRAREQRGRMPLLPPSLLRIPTLRLGLLVSILFFACWSGFMFTLALTLQGGVGLSSLQSGNAFIALGLSYFAGAMLSSRHAGQIPRTRLLLWGCAIQMPGLMLLMLTLYWGWQHVGIVLLAPATMLIGFGQSFIVGSIYRICLTNISAAQAGAASATVNTVMQIASGLGAALMGSLFARLLGSDQHYQYAMLGCLLLELILMALVVILVCHYRRGEVRLAAAQA